MDGALSGARLRTGAAASQNGNIEVGKFDLVRPVADRLVGLGEISSDEKTCSGAGIADGDGNRRLWSEVNCAGIEDLDTIVVIYAENRSFDNLYGGFPGANGLAQATRLSSLSWTATGRCSSDCRRCGAG